MDLLKKVKAGDEFARDEFIIANLRLVLSVVQRFGGKKFKDGTVFVTDFDHIKRDRRIDA